MSPAGRPEIGKPVNIRLDDEMLAAVDELAEISNLSRAAMIRSLLRDGLMCQKVGTSTWTTGTLSHPTKPVTG